MPKYKPTALAYAESGLIKDRQAYITPNEAYTELLNAYVWRGITKRRLAPEFLGRLRRVIAAQAQANTLNSDTYTIADLLTGVRANEPNASIECGSLVITLDPGGGNETVFTDQGDGTLLRTSGTAYDIASSTINYNTGAITITWTAILAAGIAVQSDYAYFPNLPCMGIHVRESATTSLEAYVFFDTIYAYEFSAGAGKFIELVSAAATTWSGTDSDFFWHLNYWELANARLFWATNGKFGTTVALTDPIRYYNGATWNAAAFIPATNGVVNNYLLNAKILVAYRGRLIALNTLESSANADPANLSTHQNRARWSQNGDPTDIVNGWRDDIQGRGGYRDAPTNEAIVSAAFVRDTLVVYFERSTWKLRYTGNEIFPFVWERINIELGSESKKSIVRFDDGIMAVGAKGIHICDGNHVKKIDEKIPDEVFKIHNGNNGVERVQGARNFLERLVYWTVPMYEQNPVYPNRLLVYNYDNGAWAYFDDHFTALGSFQKTTDATWASLSTTLWSQYRVSWNGGRLQSGFPLVAGGNQQGYVSLLNAKVANDKTLYIKAITAATPASLNVISHNMQEGDVIEINGVVGSDADTLNGYRYRVSVTDANNITIAEKDKWTITAIALGPQTILTVPGNTIQVGDRVELKNVGGTVELNDNTYNVIISAGNLITIDVDSSSFTAYTTGGTAQNLDSLWQDVALASSNYLGCGEITRISNFVIASKKFSVMPEGAKTTLGYFDFLVDRTDKGVVSVPIFVDYNQTQSINPRQADSVFNWEFPTTNIDFATQGEDKVWHRVYCTLQAQFFQFRLTLDDGQLVSKELQASDFVLNAAIIWQSKDGRLVK